MYVCNVVYVRMWVTLCMYVMLYVMLCMNVCVACVYAVLFMYGRMLCESVCMCV